MALEAAASEGDVPCAGTKLPTQKVVAAATGARTPAGARGMPDNPGGLGSRTHLRAERPSSSTAVRCRMGMGCAAPETG